MGLTSTNVDVYSVVVALRVKVVFGEGFATKALHASEMTGPANTFKTCDTSRPRLTRAIPEVTVIAGRVVVVPACSVIVNVDLR